VLKSHFWPAMDQDARGGLVRREIIDRGSPRLSASIANSAAGASLGRGHVPGRPGDRPASLIISSDVYFDWMPPHVEVLRMFTGQLRFLGAADDQLRAMLVGNPARVLKLAAPVSGQG
jgi:hypothetical protein